MDFCGRDKRDSFRFLRLRPLIRSFPVSGIKASSMRHLLNFLYTGQTCLKEVEIKELRELIKLLDIKTDIWDEPHTSYTQGVTPPADKEYEPISTNTTHLDGRLSVDSVNLSKDIVLSIDRRQKYVQNNIVLSDNKRSGVVNGLNTHPRIRRDSRSDPFDYSKTEERDFKVDEPSAASSVGSCYFFANIILRAIISD